MPNIRPGSIEEAQQKLRNILGGEGLETDVQKENREIEEAEGEATEDTQVEETSENEAASSETQETATTDVEEQGEASENEESSEVSTLSELAESIDTDIETLYGLKISVTEPDGKPTEVTLAHLKDTLQKSRKIEEEQIRFENDRATFENERQQVEAVLLQRLQEADSFLNAFEEALTAEEQKVDWAWLRENNPAEYSAKKAEVAEQKERLRSQRTQIQQQAVEHKQEQVNQLQQKLYTTKAVEEKKLLGKIPTWTDSKVADTEKDQLKVYLNKEGFSDQDIGMTLDHRLIVMARKAMMFDQGTKKVSAAKKRIKKLPKRVKPSSPRAKASESTEAQKKLRGRLRKTGRLNDAALLIKSRIKAAI